MNLDKKLKKIILTGGGTAGSVSPLLAITDDIKNYDILWVGTKRGLEKEMVTKEDIKFKSVCGGKFRRYFSLKNFTDIFCIIGGFFQSLSILYIYKPDLIMSAGSFISVPVVWAGWILRIPIIIHQQDARVGLANKLMAPFAQVITTTFEESLKSYGKKAIWTGNPVRQSLTEFKVQSSKYKADNFPTVFVIGGGTGALAINELIRDSLEDLTKICHVIHATGQDKSLDIGKFDSNSRYQSYGFLGDEELSEAYNKADIIVSRCGMGVLTELSYLGKPSILIPMPNTHQEDNAEIFKEKNAAIVLNQNKLTPKELLNQIDNLLNNDKLRNKLSNNIQKVIKRGANEKIVEIINDILK